MNQRQLSYFLEVYKKRSITAAAQALYISPQGLSKTILSLEDELGLKLFERSGKKMTPTTAAINLISHAKTILKEYDIIEQKQFVDHPVRKSLHILSSYDVLSFFPARFFHEFQTLYPEILLSITEMPDLQILRHLEKNEAELAFLGGPLDSTSYDLMYLFSHRFCLAMHKDHPLAKKESISLEDLQGESLAIKGMDIPLSSVQQNLFLSHGVEPSIILEISDYHVIHQMANENYCLGMTLDYLAFQDFLPNVVIRPFSEETLLKSIYLVHRKSGMYSENAALFKEFLHGWLAQQPHF